ncbi:hypothetical protein E3T46_14870 [Cryobacterium sp. Hh11]|uniref:hypothetical protein n=1 Tax=Cryobacterium sp. Hh11 TaxID=2555868 RepID=UPI00106BFB6C|nr:hypothetical protein [Cryobacterium sp. Hh11]TFD48709.1 hypothetical protein E3T46_14870 [Cryobacterium sp. Hh11]
MNWVDLFKFKTTCERVSVDVPQPILRGLDIIEVAKAHNRAPSGGLLDLSDDAVRDRVTNLSIRRHQGPAASSRGMTAGIEAFTDELLIEVREACLPELDQIIIDLQPRFDELAAPLVAAAQVYGFTLATTSDMVIELADEKASQAWRDSREAWASVGPIVSLRTLISDAFKVSPTPEETDRMFFTAGKFRSTDHSIHKQDYSVCFAAGDNWSYDGVYYLNNKSGGTLDWFALAGGGLRLNTPAEVQAKHQRKSSTPAVFTVQAEEVVKTSSHAAILPRYDR